MPEGHTLRFAAAKLVPLVGHAPSVEAPHPRYRASQLGAALDGRTLERVTPRGKHLLLRFEGGRIVHSHLRMSGAWDAYADGAPWRRAPRRAWLVLRDAGRVVVQFDGPVLELLQPGTLALHPVLSRLGPDVLDERFDPVDAVARVRRGAGERAIGDALLDQRICCGIGNMFRAEALFARRLHPFTAVADLGDAELLQLYAEAARQMRAAVDHGRELPKRVYGRPTCPRCDSRVERRALGDEGRIAHWCPVCQPAA